MRDVIVSTHLRISRNALPAQENSFAIGAMLQRVEKIP
jgi:hypothetical protein